MKTSASILVALVLCGCWNDDLKLCPPPKTLEQICAEQPFGNDCADYATYDRAVATALEQCRTPKAWHPVSLLSCDNGTRGVISGDGYAGAIYVYDHDDKLSNASTYGDIGPSCKPRPEDRYDAAAVVSCTTCALCGELRRPACEGEVARPLIEACLAAPPPAAAGVEECACTRVYPLFISPLEEVTRYSEKAVAGECRDRADDAGTSDAGTTKDAG